MSTTEPKITSPIEPFVVRSDENRKGELFRLLGETITVKIGERDTAGLFSVAIEESPPQSGPPIHRHLIESEWFYVLEGEYRFLVGEETITVREGDSLWAPRGIQHTFQNISSKTGRLLAINQPAGLERFFAEMEKACAQGMPDPEILRPICDRHGIELLGPPLAQQG